jgi:two-component system, LytTR family, sensor kinase
MRLVGKMNKSRLYWALQVGGWSLFSLFQVSFNVAVTPGSMNATKLTFFLAEGLLFFIISHLFRNTVIRWGWLELSFVKLIPRALPTIFIMGYLVYLLRIGASFPLGLYNAEVFNLANMIGLTLVNSLFFFLWSLLYFIYHYFERYNLALKHQAAIKEIELNNLKSQLNPHFIFNALNSIRALVDENPAKSKLAITQLSGILRNSLITEKKGLTDFEDELKTVKDYLSLESIRFEERLKVFYDIHPESRQFMVPSLMLQTLIENGVKHGISKLKEGGTVTLSTSVEAGKLHIRIRNSGKYQRINGIKSRRKGLGLANTEQRLKLIYGDDASFRIFNDADNMVLTELIIPNKTL